MPFALAAGMETRLAVCHVNSALPRHRPRFLRLVTQMAAGVEAEAVRGIEK